LRAGALDDTEIDIPPELLQPSRRRFGPVMDDDALLLGEHLGELLDSLKGAAAGFRTKKRVSDAVQSTVFHVLLNIRMGPK
jgi:hypothetical protein